MKILLTGGTGYIGSHAAVELIEAGYDIEILDNLYNSKITVLDRIKEITGVKPRFHEVDMRDYKAMEEVFKSGNFDLVMHFAGLKAVAESIEKPLEYYDNNVCGTINLLRCMKKYDVKKIIFSSSATVYGQQASPMMTEDLQTGVGITNPYGKTKFVIEEILKDLHDTEVVIFRYFNPIGAHPSGLIGEDPNDIPNNIMPVIVRVATGRADKIKVFGDDYDTPDGTGVRDFIHVVDLVKGHVAVINNMKPGVAIYNLGTGSGTSVLELISRYEKISGKKLPYEITSRRPGDLAEVFASPAKAEAELGWRAELTVDDAIRDVIKFLEHDQ